MNVALVVAFAWASCGLASWKHARQGFIDSAGREPNVKQCMLLGFVLCLLGPICWVRP